jgi:hypothetical protein
MLMHPQALSLALMAVNSASLMVSNGLCAGGRMAS